jgi:hypothetical protein
VGDSLDLAAGMRSLSHHHSCLGIRYRSPARSRHCYNRRIHNHPADIVRTAEEDTVEAAVEHNLVEDQAFEQLFRYMDVVAVGNSPDRMPSRLGSQARFQAALRFDEGVCAACYLWEFTFVLTHRGMQAMHRKCARTMRLLLLLKLRDRFVWSRVRYLADRPQTFRKGRVARAARA